jgi:hypothetical protein
VWSRTLAAARTRLDPGVFGSTIIFNSVAQIAIPAEHRPNDVVEFSQPELVRDFHHPDHHRIHVAQYGP